MAALHAAGWTMGRIIIDACLLAAVVAFSFLILREKLPCARSTPVLGDNHFKHINILVCDGRLLLVSNTDKYRAGRRIANAETSETPRERVSCMASSRMPCTIMKNVRGSFGVDSRRWWDRLELVYNSNSVDMAHNTSTVPQPFILSGVLLSA